MVRKPTEIHRHYRRAVKRRAKQMFASFLCICKAKKWKRIQSFFLASDSQQALVNDSTDKSDGKMFEVINSSRCPVKTNAIENFIKHLNPKLDCLFQ